MSTTYVLGDEPPYEDAAGNLAIPLKDGTELVLTGSWYVSAIHYGGLATGPLTEAASLVGNNRFWPPSS
jgi:hypothetical protein